METKFKNITLQKILECGIINSKNTIKIFENGFQIAIGQIGRFHVKSINLERGLPEFLRFNSHSSKMIRTINKFFKRMESTHKNIEKIFGIIQVLIQTKQCPKP